MAVYYIWKCHLPIKNYPNLFKIYSFSSLNGGPSTTRLFARLSSFSHFGPSTCTCLPPRWSSLMLLPTLSLTRPNSGSGPISITLSECVLCTAWRSKISALVSRNAELKCKPVWPGSLKNHPKAPRIRGSLLIRSEANSGRWKGIPCTLWHRSYC